MLYCNEVPAAQQSRLDKHDILWVIYYIVHTQPHTWEVVLMKWVNAERWRRGSENFLCTLFIWARKHAKSSALPRLLEGCCTCLAALFIKSIPIAPFCTLAVCCSAYAYTVFTSSSSLQLQSSIMLSSISLSVWNLKINFLLASGNVWSNWMLYKEKHFRGATKL